MSIYSQVNDSTFSPNRLNDAIMMKKLLHFALITVLAVLSFRAQAQRTGRYKQVKKGLTPCLPNPCQNRGSCVANRLGKTKHPKYFCSCKRGFTGDRCQRRLTPCLPNPCQNRGSCVANRLGKKKHPKYFCSCKRGFTGDRCQRRLMPCLSNPCKNRGSCTAKEPGKRRTRPTYFCPCKRGFTGDRCQRRDCRSKPCKNGGTCVDLGETSICQCPSEFTGSVCQGKTPSITQEPEDAVRMAGGKVTFCCRAEGTPDPTYLWLRNNVQMKNKVSKTLRLTNLSIADDGVYKCRATNKYGKAVSSEVKLTVIAGSGDDTCDPTPMRKEVTLPPGCTEDSSKSNIVNVGTCSYNECIKRGQGDSGSCRRGKDKIKRCCSPISPPLNSPVSCTNGVKFNVEKVGVCKCSLCAVPDIVVRGRVVDEEGNALLMGLIEVKGDKNVYYTDLAGNFGFTVKAGSKKMVLNITDPYGKLQDTTKAFQLHEEQISFYNIVLQKKPPAVKFEAAQKKEIPLSAPAKPSFAAVNIPERAFVTADGKVYDGEITANVGVIDPRSEADMAAAPGDFSTTDDDGEEVMLASAGMLRQSFFDSRGNKLNLYKNISVRIDVEKLDLPDGATVYQYYLNKETGRWVKFGVLRTEEEDVGEHVGRPKRQLRRRKFFVGEITPNVPYDTINWDYPEDVSYVRVVAPAGSVVTRIGRGNDGQSFNSYRQETVPASGILCIRSLLNRPAVMQAERHATPLIPQQPEKNFPAVVNARISRNPDDPVKSFQFTSVVVGTTGPVYGMGKSNRCRKRRGDDLAFRFRKAASTATFQWRSTQVNKPGHPLHWKTLFPELCFIKAIVTGSRTRPVIYVKSIGKSPRDQQVLKYGYVAERTTRLRGERASVVCLEYRCNQGSSATSYKTHLQFISLTGTCRIASLSSVLQTAQGRCTVTPDADSSQEQNICVPDIIGGAVGLYKGRDENEARSRCLTGDNNSNQRNPSPTGANPAVRLICS